MKLPWKLRSPRRFPPTREGWWFLVATLLVGAAALNGGINLLFFIFGMMLSLILASGVLSELALRDLEVTRRPPAYVHAGAPFLMGIAVRNRKRRLPTFSLEVEDLVGGKPVERRCYFLKLPAGRSQETAYKQVVARRGIFRISGFRLATRFPFGFIRKSLDLAIPLELLVLPALVPVPDETLRAGLAELGRRHLTRKSRRGEFEGLREYRSGDDPRDIHWRTSARRGRLVVREAEEETGHTIVVALENELPSTAEAFEAAVSLAASLAVKLVKTGLHVGLATADQFVPPSAGAAHAVHLLRVLALVQPDLTSTRVARSERSARGAGVIRIVPGEASPRFEPAAGGDRRTA